MGGWERGLIGEPELGVICVAVEMYAVYGKDVAKGKEVDGAEEAPLGQSPGAHLK